MEIDIKIRGTKSEIQSVLTTLFEKELISSSVNKDSFEGKDPNE
ncbi:hypothetical protein ACED51_04480 [Photobacterium swingsii]